MVELALGRDRTMAPPRMDARRVLQLVLLNALVVAAFIWMFGEAVGQGEEKSG
jgi:hypothetical protein